MTIGSGRVVKVGRRARRAGAAARRAPKRGAVRVVTVARPLCTRWRRRADAAVASAPALGARPNARASQVAPGPGLCTGTDPFVLEGRREWCGRDTLTLTEWRLTRGVPELIGEGQGWLGARVDLHSDARVAGAQGTYWTRIAFGSGSGTYAAGATLHFRIRCRALNDTEDCISDDDVERERLAPGEDTELSRSIRVSEGDFRGGRRFYSTAWLDLAPGGAGGGGPEFIDGFLPTDQIRCNRAGGLGCVYPDFEPTFSLSLSDPTVAASAGLIAISQPGLVAAGERSGVPGERPLVKESNGARIRANRRLAVRRCRRGGRRPAGHDCDEYPFASARLRGDAFQAAWIPARPNRAAGSRLGIFYRRERVLDEDGFYVRIDP
jgi:hypothetical protein